MRLTLLIGLIAACIAAPLSAADTAPASSPSEPAVDARGLMRLGGIGPDAWARFQDGPPMTNPERETLQKILFRLAGLPIDQLEHLAGPSIDWKRLLADPSAYRGDLVRLEGQVRSVDVIPLPKPWADRFGLRQCYRVEMVLDQSQQPVVVFARKVPKSWLAGRSLDQPGGAWAMFVKLENDKDGLPRPVFAAPRLAWYPKDRLLGQLGMDASLLDDLVDRKPLRGRERECFYQALAAAARAEPGQLEKAAGAPCSVVPLFNEPASQRGKLVALAGTARRVLRVRVDQPDVQRRLGIDHYYEIYLYTGDSQSNPLVICVTRLPEGMPTGDGPDYAEPVSVAGFFLKSWAYPSGRKAEPDRKDQAQPLQLAPLLVGREPVRLESSHHGASPIWGLVGGGLFVLVLLVIWLWLLKTARADRRIHRAADKDVTTDWDDHPNRQAGESKPILDSSIDHANNTPDDEPSA